MKICMYEVNVTAVELELLRKNNISFSEALAAMCNRIAEAIGAINLSGIAAEAEEDGEGDDENE